jgi:Fe2+ transport system protein B
MSTATNDVEVTLDLRNIESGENNREPCSEEQCKGSRTTSKKQRLLVEVLTKVIVTVAVLFFVFLLSYNLNGDVEKSKLILNLVKEASEALAIHHNNSNRSALNNATRT